MNKGRLATVRKVNHTGITVSDLDAVLAFFTHALGFAVTKPVRQSGPAVSRMLGLPDVELEMAFAYGGGHVIEFMQYHRPRGETVSRFRPCDVGCTHLAFEVEDLETVAESLRQAGHPPISEPEVVPFGPRKGGRNIYVRGPDNLLLEFQQAPEGFIDPFSDR